MLLTIPFSVPFWICYCVAVLSDILDGFIARKLNLKSETGAKLDSISDFVFAVALFIIVVKEIHLSIWIWACVMLIVALRFISYGIGFYKYRTFSSLHTYSNKATGVLCILFPILLTLIGLNLSIAIIFIASLISSIEELVITVKSKELNRDCTGIFNS